MLNSMILGMNSSSTITSSQRWYQHMRPFTFLFFALFTIFSTVSVSSSTTPISYADYCASVVPESTPTVPEYTTFSSLRILTSYFAGGDRILGKQNSSQFSFNYQKSLSFRTTRNAYRTNMVGIYKIVAYLILEVPDVYYLPENSTHRLTNHRPRMNSLEFKLIGFWSESSGKLCMVGSASWDSKDGNFLNLDAVLKLNYAENSTIVTSLVNGTLESLSFDESKFFEPISILGLPSMSHYNYTLVSEGSDNGCPGGIDISENLSLSFQRGSVCSMLSRHFHTFELKYASECSSSQNCTPFVGDIGYLPRLMSLYGIQCSEEEQKLRYLVEFPINSYTRYFQPSTLNATLVGEGVWHVKKNQLCIAACRILNTTDSLGNAYIGDCSIRMSLRYPSTWTIRNRSNIVGQIWTNKTANDSGYFDRITFRSSENSMVGFSDLRYEYTEIDKVRRTCPMKKKPIKNRGERYPGGYSYDMRFDMSIKNSDGEFSWGSAVPISVGDQPSPVFISGSTVEDSAVGEPPIVESNPSRSGPLNISYEMSFKPLVKLVDGMLSSNLSWSPNGQVEISAEGIYDAETGHLCMVGCRKLGSYIEGSTNLDCEILVNFQFPPSNSKNGGFVKGSIESTRKSTDPLYFKRLKISSNAVSIIEAKQSIWRMDLEIIMVMISNTLACIFVVLQLFYVKKHPDVLPSISLVMLVILTLGHMISLVLNLETLFLKNGNPQNVLRWSGGWFEVNDVIVRVVTMVAFLLQFHLLQLAWSVRVGDGNKKGLWVPEMKALFVSLTLYIVGGLIVVLVNWVNNRFRSMLNSFGSVVYQELSLWEDLRSYGSLVLDGFLFPQILLNIFQTSRESSALCHSFYIGTTFVRLLPHAYDLYKPRNDANGSLEGTPIYANPTAVFYSSTWDVIISCGGIFFAAIIYLQQRFGGRIFSRKFEELEAYEKVPVVSCE